MLDHQTEAHMNITDPKPTKTKVRKVRDNGASQILKKIAEMSAQAAESLRRDEHRARKDEDRIRIVLRLYAGPVLDMLQRVEIPEPDRQFLIAKGYLPKPKKGQVNQ
jgi:hypothetical protein